MPGENTGACGLRRIGDIPQHDAAIRAARGEARAVRAEGHRVHRAAMAVKPGELAWMGGVRQLPQLCLRVVGPGGQDAAVRAEGGGPYRGAAPVGRPEHRLPAWPGAVRRVPQLGAPVLPAEDQQPSVRGEGRGVEDAVVPR